MRTISFLMAILLSATTQAANLEDIRNAAWEADNEWAAARRNWQADQETLTQGRAGLLPSVNASYSDFEVEQDPENAPTTQEYDTSTLAVQATQPLFRPGAWFGYQQAKAATSAAEAQFQQARQDFLLRVSEQYLGVLRTWDNLVTARAEEKAIARQLEQTRERFDVGLVPRTDVEEARAAYDLSRVNLIVAESDFHIARDRLEALTGKRWEQLAVLREELPLAGPDPADPAKWVKLAQESNPGVVAADFSAKSARYQARQGLSAQLPTVDLVGQWSDTEDAFFDGQNQPVAFQTETTRVGIEVKLPLFQGGALNSQRKQAAFRHEAAKERYQLTHRDVGQQARSQYRVVEADVLRVKARRQAIRSARSALEATRSGYEVGTRNVVDVLNAQRTLYAAQRDYDTARYDYIQDSLRLKALAGVLEEKDLAQVNGWLSETRMVDLYQSGQDAASSDSTR